MVLAGCPEPTRRSGKCDGTRTNWEEDGPFGGGS